MASSPAGFPSSTTTMRRQTFSIWEGCSQKYKTNFKETNLLAIYMHHIISKRRRDRVWESDNHHKICAIVWSDSKLQIVTLLKLSPMKWATTPIHSLWSVLCKPHQTRTTEMREPIFYFHEEKRSWSMTWSMVLASRMSRIFLMYLPGTVTPNCYTIQAKATKRSTKPCNTVSFKTLTHRSNPISPLSPSGK